LACHDTKGLKTEVTRTLQMLWTWGWKSLSVGSLRLSWLPELCWSPSALSSVPCGGFQMAFVKLWSYVC